MVVIDAAKLLTGSTGFVDVFRIDSMDMNALTGNARTKCFDRFSGLFPRKGTISIEKYSHARPKPRMRFHMMNLLRAISRG
jgi:hypothetical protein